MRVTTFLPRQAGLFVLFVIGAILAPARAEDTVITLPFALASNKIYIQTQVNGRGPYPFVMDTGAPFTVLDWDLAQGLGITVHRTGDVSGAGHGMVKLGTARGVRIAAHDLRYQPRRMEVIPLNSTLATAEGRDVMGLIGGDILARFVSEIDFAGRVVRLHSVHDFAYEGPGVRVPISTEGHILARATVTFAGREPISGRFVIDTGARIAVSLNTHVVNGHRLLDDDIDHIRTTIGWGLGGPLEHGLARATSLVIGEVAFDAPTVTLSQDTRGIFASSRIAGVIGNEVLKRCRVFIDYQREELILEPVRPAMETAFPADASGLFITASGPDHRVFTVRTVVADSPAAEAGLRAGDVIGRINEEDAGRYTLEQLRTLFLEPGASYELVVRREGERRTVRLATRKLI